MKISTIIPVYNADIFLKRCLDSIISQNLSDTEIICIDDGSTDSSWEILQTYNSKFDNIHIFRQKNQYAGTARNVGLKKAKGEYVHFLDADDYLFPESYNEVYNFAVSMNADYVKFRSGCFSMATGMEKNEEHPDYICAYLNQEDFGQVISIEDHPTELIEAATHVPWSGIFKRNFLLDHQIEFNNLRCVNDRSFYVKVITNTRRIVYMDKYVVNHQLDNPDSLLGIRGDNFECQLLSYSIIKNYLNSILDRLDYNIYKRILSFELCDVFGWYCCLSNVQKEEIKTELYRFLITLDWSEINKSGIMYHAMREINFLFDEYKIVSIEKTRELPAIVKNYKYCYIYGAGVMAGNMIEYLRTKKVIPEAVIVSSDSDELTFKGLTVYKIDEFVFQADVADIIIVLSAKSNYHLQMLQHLRVRGIKNIVTISDKDFEELGINGSRDNER